MSEEKKLGPDLVVVASLQHHVEDCLVELVLDQEVCVKEPLEHLRRV